MMRKCCTFLTQLNSTLGINKVNLNFESEHTPLSSKAHKMCNNNWKQSAYRCTVSHDTNHLWSTGSAECISLTGVII